MSDNTKHVKCVVVGDNGVGKTTLLIRYTTGSFCPEQEVPVVFDNYTESIRVNGEFYALALWDTHKEEEHDRIRPLSYPGTDVVLICFSVAKRTSFENVKGLWVDEVHHFCPGVPWVLVGTRIDLRNDESLRAKDAWLKPVTTAEGHHLAKQLKAFKYIECSALSRSNVDEVFELAIVASQLGTVSCRRRKACVLL